MRQTGKAVLFILFSVFCFSIHALAAAPAKKPVKYACEEYSDSLVKLPMDGRILVPWPSLDHADMNFLDGVFMGDDDTKVVVALLKKNPSLGQFGHTVLLKIYDTVGKNFIDLGTEDLADRQNISIIKADSSVFSFIKSDGNTVQAEAVTYAVPAKSRSFEIIHDLKKLKNTLFYGGFDVSGLSLEPVLNDYSQYIAARRFESNGKLYDGLAAIDRKTGAAQEVLRFGNKPYYLRHSGNISFDYKDSRDFKFGFYNVKAKNAIYYMDGNNMVFRHMEKGVGMKEYLNLTRLRSVSRSLSKLLFMAEDDFGARIVIVPFDAAGLLK